jgi:5-oxoprolinase (ATP-hydrolysing) subunit A
MRTIDLNCDMGEGVGDDTALMEFISSANIACGGHAGDDETMRETVRMAMERGVAIGAHPSYPDRDGFGRKEMEMSPEAIEETVWEQVSRLDRIVSDEGGRLAHVKPHGALYHAAMNNRDVAIAIAAGIRRLSPGLVLVGLAGSEALGWWVEAGMGVAAEAFADRRYEADGFLRARSKAGAMIEDPAVAAEQAVRIAEGRGVVAEDGTVVDVRAGTICVHGDTAGAEGVARAVRRSLERAGIRVRAPGW